jgi:hypothetical protein
MTPTDESAELNADPSTYDSSASNPDSLVETPTEDSSCGEGQRRLLLGGDVFCPRDAMVRMAGRWGCCRLLGGRDLSAEEGTALGADSMRVRALLQGSGREEVSDGLDLPKTEDISNEFIKVRIH